MVFWFIYDTNISGRIRKWVVTRSIPWGAWKGILVPSILILAGIYLVQSAVRGFFKKKQPLPEEIQETKEQS